MSQEGFISNGRRPNAIDFIGRVFNNYLELSGDRLCGDDCSITGGIARFQETAVTVLAQIRGRNPEESMRVRNSMMNPEGYRKAIRLMTQADKFDRPIICFIDTLGAYPGNEAETRGQASAIANCIRKMSEVKVPIISIVIGNGGSGGAMALGAANRIAMLENAVFSVISPKGGAGILWRDAGREEEAADLLKIRADYLKEFQAVDEIIPEGGVEKTSENLKEYLLRQLHEFACMQPEQILEQRYFKFRCLGNDLLFNVKDNMSQGNG